MASRKTGDELIAEMGPVMHVSTFKIPTDLCISLSLKLLSRLFFSFNSDFSCMIFQIFLFFVIKHFLSNGKLIIILSD